MLEKLLETLVRIAVALEIIANKEPAATITETYKHQNASTDKLSDQELEKQLKSRTNLVKKEEAKPEAKKPETKKAETKKAAEDEVTFDQCKASFLTLAKGLRDVHGVEKMKKITLGILNDFTGGQPLSTASLLEDKYLDFYKAVEDSLSNLNAANTEE